MAKVFFTSDLHFGHNNLCEGLRGMSFEQNDSLIISNWNNTVSKRDIVYILRDITLGKEKLLEKYLRQLNGNIRIVGGNHDTRKCCEVFQRLGIVVMGCAEYKGFICTHIPIHEAELSRYTGNIHGHIYVGGYIKGLGNYKGANLLNDRYYNVNTEFHGYTPVCFDDIEKYFEKIS